MENFVKKYGSEHGLDQLIQQIRDEIENGDTSSLTQREFFGD